MKLIIKPKCVYGIINNYPDNDLAFAMVKLLKQKTFTPHQLDQLEAMGFEIIYTTKLEK